LPLWAGGEFALAKHQIEESIAAPSLPVKWGTAPHEHDLYAILTDIAMQQRDVAAIRQYAPLAEQFALRDQHQLYLAITHRARGVAHRLSGEYADAESRFNRALEIFDVLGTRWQTGRTLFEFGELEEARQDRAGAREKYSRALVEFEAMRAAPDAAATRLRLQKIA
jgi:tetratricopeptide (TPR) repeat protein